MNKLLMATAAVAFATAGTAGAADLPTKAPPMVAAAPIASWTGCYVDGGIGYGMWNQDHSVNNAGLAVNSVTTTDGGRGWLGRIGVGCDYQVAPQFLIGAFGDWDWMNLKGSQSPSERIAVGNITAPVTANIKETNAGYAGVRVGYLPYPNLLTFISGGWTRAHFTESQEFRTDNGAAIAFGFPGSYNVNGWFIGGGTEYRLPWWQNLTWKTEYRFSQFSSRDVAEVNLATGAAIGLSEHMEKFTQTVTTSLVWRFNFGGPVVARY
jgi:outer membrane immunogenic protein